MTEADLRDITGLAVSARLARLALAACTVGFAVVGLLLLIAPANAAGWLGLPYLDPTEWALRVAGAVLLGLAGQSWLVRRAGEHPVMGASAVTVATAALLAMLLITMPGDWGWLRIACLAMCALTAAMFLLILTASRRP